MKYEFNRIRGVTSRFDGMTEEEINQEYSRDLQEINYICKRDKKITNKEWRVNWAKYVRYCRRRMK